MNTMTVSRSAGAKATLLKGITAAPAKMRATPERARCTPRLLANMAIAGIVAGACLYVAFVLGVSRVTPDEPIHSEVPAHHHTARGNV
jgi:hypothetical protein